MVNTLRSNQTQWKLRKQAELYMNPPVARRVLFLSNQMRDVAERHDDHKENEEYKTDTV